MHVHVQIVAVRLLRVGKVRPEAGGRGAGTGIRIGGAAQQVCAWEFTLANVDAAPKRAGVVVDAVVGDLNVVSPTVHEDGAAALRAVGDGQAVDPGRIAPEVAGVVAGGSTRGAIRAGIAGAE